MSQHQQATVSFRPAVDDDLPALLDIEQRCLETDRLSRRSFRHWVHSDHGILLVMETAQCIIGYGPGLVPPRNQPCPPVFVGDQSRVAGEEVVASAAGQAGTDNRRAGLPVYAA